MSEEKKDGLIAAELQQEMTKAVYLYEKENNVKPKHVIIALNRMIHQQGMKLFDESES